MMSLTTFLLVGCLVFLAVQQGAQSADDKIYHLEATDSVLLTYTTTQQRDDLLQTIAGSWNAVLSRHKITDIHVSFVSEKDAGTAKQVVYKVSGNGPPGANGEKNGARVPQIKAAIRKNIQSVNNPNIALLSADQQAAFDASSDNLDNMRTTKAH
ncbi:hypothetical protein BV898_01687 [Hypsibius exemplaris]|uniref:Secreted protein n=1 Tax=Hypsibius exemplaris TaxID=2072580 RepID=A0A1W0XB42_HYPEX|nr:hypothetical protein BV898_01687 [Hypsibius exemplaris]